MMSEGAFTCDAMLKAALSDMSAYIDEGRTVLADEFGSDYGTYFTILSSIASGRTTTSELRNAIGTEVGGRQGILQDRIQGAIPCRHVEMQAAKEESCTMSVSLVLGEPQDEICKSHVRFCNCGQSGGYAIIMANCNLLERNYV